MNNYIENNTWVRGNTRFISSVEHDIHTYIHRLYLKHGKPSVILHNKYSLNYSELKSIWIHIVYIYIYINITNMKLLFYQVAVWESEPCIFLFII
jgi:hypothetical protein